MNRVRAACFGLAMCVCLAGCAATPPPADKREAAVASPAPPAEERVDGAPPGRGSRPLPGGDRPPHPSGRTGSGEGAGGLCRPDPAVPAEPVAPRRGERHPPHRRKQGGAGGLPGGSSPAGNAPGGDGPRRSRRTNPCRGPFGSCRRGCKRRRRRSSGRTKSSRPISSGSRPWRSSLKSGSGCSAERVLIRRTLLAGCSKTGSDGNGAQKPQVLQNAHCRRIVESTLAVRLQALQRNCI